MTSKSNSLRDGLHLFDLVEQRVGQAFLPAVPTTADTNVCATFLPYRRFLFKYYEKSDAFNNRLQQYRPCIAFEWTLIKHKPIGSKGE